MPFGKMLVTDQAVGSAKQVSVTSHRRSFAYHAATLVGAIICVFCPSTTQAQRSQPQIKTSQFLTPHGFPLTVEVVSDRLKGRYEYLFAMNNQCSIQTFSRSIGKVQQTASADRMIVGPEGVSFQTTRMHSFENRVSMILGFRRWKDYLTYSVGSWDGNHWQSELRFLKPSPFGIYVDAHPISKSINLIEDAGAHEFDIVPELGVVVLKYIDRMDGANKLLDTGLEIRDPDTGKVTWSWVSHGRVNPADYLSTKFRTGSDWYNPMHVNSVQWLPSRKSFLLSSRFMNALLEVAYPSGEVREVIRCGDKWKCDGDPNNGFIHQHHARMNDNASSLTLFDNANPAPIPRPSRGVVYNVNWETRTLKFVRHYPALGSFPHRENQGGHYELPDRTVAVAWGGIRERCDPPSLRPAEPDNMFTHFTEDGLPIVNVKVPYGWHAYRVYAYPIDK